MVYPEGSRADEYRRFLADQGRQSVRDAREFHVAPRIRRSKRDARRKFWYSVRYDKLLLEGFTPEEAQVIASVRISSPPIRNLRKRRIRRVVKYIKQGYDFYDAIDKVRDEVRDEDEEVIDWQTLMRIFY